VCCESEEEKRKEKEYLFIYGKYWLQTRQEKADLSRKTRKQRNGKEMSESQPL